MTARIVTHLTDEEAAEIERLRVEAERETRRPCSTSAIVASLLREAIELRHERTPEA